MMFTKAEELYQHEAADHEVGEELGPGIVVERRTVLRLAAMGGLALLGGGALARQEGTTDIEKPDMAPLDLETIVNSIRPLAQDLIKDPNPNEDAYLFAIAQMLSRLQHMPEAKEAHRNVNMSVEKWLPPIVVYQIRMKPNSVIALHDHRDYNGVLFGVDGQVKVRNFDLYGISELPEAGEEFSIQQTADAILTPGRVSTLSRTRDNIHEVRTGDQEVRLLDVFTFFEKGAQSYWFDFDDKPYDEQQQLYKVAWRK